MIPITLILAILVSLCSGAASVSAETRPNVLLIVCDDLNNHVSTSGYSRLRRRAWRKAELYDLINGPHEDNNLASKPRFAEQRRQMHSLLAETRKSAESKRKLVKPPKK